MVHRGFQYKVMQISVVLSFGADAERIFLKAGGAGRLVLLYMNCKPAY
jgi:hypothetical protein